MGRMLSAMTHRRKDRESNVARAIVRTRRRGLRTNWGRSRLNPASTFLNWNLHARAESSKFGGEVGCPRSQLGAEALP